MDGLPGIIDPRAYKTFIIAGDTENPDFCFYPSWSKAATTTEYKLKDATDKEKDFKTINAKYTWNAWVGGSWGDLNAIKRPCAGRYDAPPRSEVPQQHE